ncbi:MAG: PP2C family protein-serine/threonine phosphatase [Cyclobacteriaceae bacterium]|nr:SpoIIE family protein phosphatase [Cyclobacteriaceae bacterium]MCH8516528.1 PP2C family protein-serine/threonine phosphatase [Cyclobacteriaceae bacterium]
MVSKKYILRVTAILIFIFWSVLTAVNLLTTFSISNNLHSGTTKEVSNVVYLLFFLAAYFHYRYRFYRSENYNFQDLLWKIFISSTLTSFFILVVSLFFDRYSERMFFNNAIVINATYQIILGLITVIMIHTFTVWKKLVLYQKSKRLFVQWQVFEYAILAALLFPFFNFDVFDTYYNVILSVVTLYGISISVGNLKWVVYLNFKQKWKAIIILLIVGINLSFFMLNLLAYEELELIIFKPLTHVVIPLIFAFLLIYGLFSILVILFNLPTSSVFERNFEDVFNFQRLSESPGANMSEDQVYHLLMESASSAVMADAAWISIDEEGSSDPKKIISTGINKKEIEQISKIIKSGYGKRFFDVGIIRRNVAGRISIPISHPSFKSALPIPLIVQENKIGDLYLLKEVPDGFTGEMMTTINIFTRQASLAIENRQLLEDAIENTRYKEEIKIARHVHAKLIPQSEYQCKEFEVSGLAHSTDEVGGDYFDYKISDDDKVPFIIGDVSGKGTSAAFHTSQLKAVFHSLGLLQMQPKDFLILANQALSECLDDQSFITLTYGVIDRSKRQLYFARAGHCPTYYLSTNKENGHFYFGKSLGIGIVRNVSYRNFVTEDCISYQKGDIIALFTDGITESRNGSNEMFSRERLAEIIEANRTKSAMQIKQIVLDELFKFCGTAHLNDDYTLLIFKFL